MTESNDKNPQQEDARTITTNDPRLHVMISSTTLDLPDHRREAENAIQREGHTPVMMEHSSAESNSDAIKYSLEKVEKSQVYIGIFGLRYGCIPEDPIRNPDRLSVTELEYRHALKLGIPILTFIASESHPFTRSQIDREPEHVEKLIRLNNELTKGKVAYFDSPVDLRSLIQQSLHTLKVQIEQRVPAEVISRLLPPVPPEYFADIEYILTDTFVGRATELDLLDNWAQSSNTFMVVEGLGGLGKSALTWEWFQTRATIAFPNLAGRIWGNFYGPDASLNTFLRNAIAYITRDFPPSHYSIQECCRLLLAELKKRPYLLVMDGFERVLAAYHRWDKAQQRDDSIDAAIRGCVDPRDTVILKQLLNCSPSKVMISTRLFPSALENRGSARPARGVQHHHLNGLSSDDTRAYFRQVGIQGDEQKMLDFAKRFGNHSLVLKVICGDICNYPRRPGNFDVWRDDPVYGGRIKLSELDLKQNYTHILHFALTGLDDVKRKLLCRLAVLSEHLDYETSLVINPYLPVREAGVNRDAYYKSAEMQDAIMQFDTALRELSDRGLVQWDRKTGYFDMHPVVRGHAADLLPDDERQTTFLAVRDHFEAMPEEDHQSATELLHVRHSIELYKSLLGAGLWDEAAVYFTEGEFANALLFRIGSFSLIEELLEPLYTRHKQGTAHLLGANMARVLNTLAIALSYLGREADALELYIEGMRYDIEQERWQSAATLLRNWADTSRDVGCRAVGALVGKLAEEISSKVHDVEGVSCSICHSAALAIFQGRFEDGKRLISDFHSRRVPSFSIYRPGRAEWLLCFNTFQQGAWDEAAWNQAFEIASKSRSFMEQHRLMALRGEWLLSQDQPDEAMDAVDEALKIANRSGMLVPEYHDLRAWVLARAGRSNEAMEELEQGERLGFAGEAWRILGDLEKAQECALNAYRDAWGEGPPHALHYRLEQCRALLKQLGVSEPRLQVFDAETVQPFPLEKELRALLPSMKQSITGVEEENHFPFEFIDFVRIGSAHAICGPSQDEENIGLLLRLTTHVMNRYEPQLLPAKVSIEYKAKRPDSLSNDSSGVRIANTSVALPTSRVFEASPLDRRWMKELYLIVLVQGELLSGIRGYCYFGIFANTLIHFIDRYQQSQPFNPMQLKGMVLARSTGVPSAEIQEFMRMKFSFDREQAILELSHSE